MYLKKLIIKNFRIFDEMGIELIFNEGVNAIIGENNSGKSCTGSTITPKLLMEGSLDQELMHLAYVAMTRPRRLLMLAIPNTKGIKNCGRFPENLWSYELLD